MKKKNIRIILLLMLILVIVGIVVLYRNINPVNNSISKKQENVKKDNDQEKDKKINSDISDEDNNLSVSKEEQTGEARGEASSDTRTEIKEDGSDTRTEIKEDGEVIVHNKEDKIERETFKENQQGSHNGTKNSTVELPQVPAEDE